MKKFVLLSLGLLLSSIMAICQTITVNAKSEDFANDLDLKAVAIIFGESKTVEDFENKLNNASTHISNLDLNGDGMIDYLRCVETKENSDHYIVIQACLAIDIYQDIATIYVSKNISTNTITTQIIGNEYIYGVNYVIEPVYIYRPAIYSWFLDLHWSFWHSPYYWGFYPPHYHHWAHVTYDSYWHSIHNFHYNHFMSFRYPIRFKGNMQYGNHRNDYAVRNPNNSFSQTHNNITNVRGIRNENNYRRPTTSPTTQTNYTNRSSITPQSTSRVTYNESRTPSNISNRNNSSTNFRTSGTTYRNSITYPSNMTSRSYSPTTNRSSVSNTRSYTPASNMQTRSYTPSARSYTPNNMNRGGSSFSGSRTSGTYNGGSRR